MSLNTPKQKVNVLKVKSLTNLRFSCLNYYRGHPRLDKPEYMSHVFCKVTLNADKNLSISFDISPTTGDVLQFYSNLKFGPLSSYVLVDETTGEQVNLPEFFKSISKEVHKNYESKVFSRHWRGQGDK